MVDDDAILRHEESTHEQLAQLDSALASVSVKSLDYRISRQLETIRDAAKRFDKTMLAAAAVALPGSTGLDTVIAGVLATQAAMDAALPELVTDSTIARVADALKYIGNEISIYASGGDNVHLTNALGDGLQAFYRTLMDAFGTWQLGQGPWKARRLELRLGVPDIAGRPRTYPVLKILIDGAEVLAGRRRCYTGWHPAEILGSGSSPLVATTPARRVALYVDAIGGPRAGCLAAFVKTVGNQMTWADFRRFENIYDAPAAQQGTEGGDWRDTPAPAVFNTAQYQWEIDRVNREQEWKAEPWTTALLLDEYLSVDPQAIGSVWNLGWVEPRPDDQRMFSAAFWDHDCEHGLIVALTANDGTPEQRARQMADLLFATPLDQWHGAHFIERGTRPARKP